MKKILFILLTMTIATVAHAEGKKRKIASIDPAKCETAAKEAAIKVLKNEDEGSGLNADVKPQFIALNNGGVYVISGWIQRVFDWQVVVVVNRACEVQNSFVNPL